ncbi:MAG TPA: hypothetical protein V6D08_13110 [Candidatus Obscuribacterales bacterium]
MVFAKLKKWFASSPAESREEALRRRIVTFVFIIYLLLIFEGVLRKWLFPGFHKALYFIRDPFVLYVYYLALRYKMWPRWSPLFIFGIGLGAYYIVLSMVQVLANNVNPLVCIIGWRNYFWYLPLAFIIGEQFRGRDLSRLMRLTLLVAMPIAVLVFLQFKAGPTHWLNKTFDEEATAFVVVRDIVRTSGTFTFSAGQVMFIESIVAMILTLWLLPRADRPLGPIASILATGAVLVNLYVSGSRSAFFATAIALGASLLSGLVMTNREQQLRALLLPGVISIAGAVLYVTLFTTAFEAMVERQEMAQANEGSMLTRATHIFTDLFEAIPRATVLGAGVGAGSNAGAVLATGARRFTLSENELPRLIDEAGLSGLLYVGLRFWLFGHLFWGAVVATNRSNNPLPLMLFSFEGITLLVGQMTLQGTVNGYGWLFAGFCLAANQLGLRNSRAAPARALAVQMRRR